MPWNEADRMKYEVIRKRSFFCAYQEGAIGI